MQKLKLADPNWALRPTTVDKRTNTHEAENYKYIINNLIMKNMQLLLFHYNKSTTTQGSHCQSREVHPCFTNLIRPLHVSAWL